MRLINFARFYIQVADFGLTKLIEVGNSTLHTRLVGTFGYMPPEYVLFFYLLCVNKAYHPEKLSLSVKFFTPTTDHKPSSTF